MTKFSKIFLAGGLSLSLICMMCLANRLEAGDLEEPTKQYRPSLFTVIQSKSYHAVFTSKMSFSVTNSTKILGINYKEITIGDLPVPCTAEIEYRLSLYTRPVAVRIVVIEVFPGATTICSDPMPE